MIYALKFGASLLLPPGIFILIMFGVAGWLWWKNERKPALAIVTVNLLFYLLSTWWIAGMMIGSLEDKYSRPDNLEGDCIIMLGGGAMAGT
ncbi:MAG: YdcF family protein, partial [Anaerovibrio sp.]|nr:YdcF family protein [Anaerovibrio sp.]